MEEKKTVAQIPFIAYEASMARMERTQRRLWVATLVMIGLLAGSNLAWIIHFFG